eukprot:Nitzschia sp. Nitz4//scaffold306_size21755//7321//8960//NITZ4_008589-RA/size21755-exonerate_est2genome-gene-0.12-mRNA-1//1//CDS//3329547111//9355//frame0
MRRRSDRRRSLGQVTEGGSLSLPEAPGGADASREHSQKEATSRDHASLTSVLGHSPQDFQDKWTARLLASIRSTSDPDNELSWFSLDLSSEDPVADLSAQPMASIYAPATLPEGFQLPVSLGGRTFLATIPPGGVTIGERFSVEIPPSTNVDFPSYAPVGHWKDGILTGFFRHGCCHPSVWNSCCCLPIAVAQICARLGLTWNGLIKGPDTTGTSSADGGFRQWFWTVVGYWIFRVFWFFVCIELNPKDDQERDADTYDPTSQGGPLIDKGQMPTAYRMAVVLEDVTWVLYYGYVAAIVLRRVRTLVREKYHIPKSTPCPGFMEDLCCSVACPCFVTAQIYRHTTDYEKVPAQCCTERGLTAGAPQLV